MSTSQQADPLIGRLVDGRYRVRARIARGGMATVYVATDLRLERRIALKVMHGHLSDDTVFQSRFIQEARAAARLADPHVVNVFDQGQDGDMAYLVMEYLPGITLRELLREQKRLTLPQTITIMDAILSGLAAAHRAGIVHRDVKPENVLLAEDGRIKIGDFGLARATTANTATGAQLLGTIAYLAPELVTRGTADARSDIYSLGIMLYEMLAGEQPYQGEQPMQIAFQHATDSVPRPSVKNPGVPEQLDELVLWSTEKSPDDRPVDAREMLDRLREIERELGIQPQLARTAPTTVIRDEDGAQAELTKVLPTAITGPMAAIDDVDNAARLRTATKRRARKGGWLFAIVHPARRARRRDRLVVRLGTRIAGRRSRCREHDLRAGQGVALGRGSRRGAGGRLRLRRARRHHRSVPTRTPGARVDKASTVTVFVSKGPQDHALTRIRRDAGRPGARRARRRARDGRRGREVLHRRCREPVIGATVTPRSGEPAFDCTDGCTVHEGDSAVLSVSVGAGSGRGGQERRRRDGGAQREGPADRRDDRGDERKRRRRASSSASRIATAAASWRPGEAVTLVVSSGPPLFPVPNVVGMTRDQAKAALDDGRVPVRLQLELATSSPIRDRGRGAGPRGRLPAHQGHRRRRSRIRAVL